MASNDAELIDEARALTDYDSDIISDAEFQALVGLGKTEIQNEVGSEVQFYNSAFGDATRALFWFVCIAAKIKVGEIAGVDITVGDIQAAQPQGSPNEFYFENFQTRIIGAQNEEWPGPAHTTLSRDNRTYGDNS